MDPWTKINDLVESCSDTSTFTKLTLAFEVEFHQISVAYHKAHYEALEKVYQQHIQFPGPLSLSEKAKEERLLIVFCLAKLVELYDRDIQGFEAAQQVIQDVRAVEDWDDESFARSIPHNAESIFGAKPTQKAFRLCRTLYHRPNAFVTSFAQSYPWLSGILVQLHVWIWILISIMLSMAVALQVFEYVYEAMKYLINTVSSNTVGIRHGLIGFNWMATWASSSWSWAWTAQRVAKGHKDSTITNFVAGFANWWSNLLGISSPPSGSAVGFPITPIDVGITRAGIATISIANMAMNMSVLPSLSLLLLEGVHSAAAVVHAGNLEKKMELREHYWSLEPVLSNLTEILGIHQGSVPVLIYSFRLILSSALKDFEEINLPSLTKSPLARASVACCIAGVFHVPYGLIACGLSLIGSVSEALCIIQPESLANSSLCSVYHTYGISSVMIDMRIEIIKREFALKSLNRLLDTLEEGLGKLLATSTYGLKLSNQAGDILLAIKNAQNENMVSVERKLMVLDRKSKGFLQWNRAKEEEAKVTLSIDMNHLNTISNFHETASLSLATAREILSEWKMDIENIRNGLRQYERYIPEDNWKSMEDTWRYWQELKGQVKSLEPLLYALSDAHEKVASKYKHSELITRGLFEECKKRAKDKHGLAMVAAKSITIRDCMLGVLEDHITAQRS